MNQRLVGGLFALAISLALVGAAVTAQDSSSEPITSDGLASFALDADPMAEEVELATAQVPLRSADLETQARLWRADDVASPVAVRVAALGLEAQVRSVGVDANNDFDVPEAETVGWYKHGPAPGQAGSTVLAAHVDYGGAQGAFFNLAELAADDTFEVELSDGSILAYRVIDTVLYDKSALPADELFRKEGDEVLRLITCGGSFDAAERSYRGNVVVTAVPLDA
ncbi:MAG: class F sortase [Actinomycetota bacterium]